MIEEHLKADYEVITANCFYMSTYNDNAHINRLIHQNISLYDIKNSQNQMLEKCKYSGIYPYIELPKSFLDHYKPSQNDKSIIINQQIAKYKTIFLYSAFTNDLLKAYNLSLFKLLRPNKLRSSLKIADTDFVFQALKNNLSDLIKLNPNIEICLIGLFVPTKIPFIRKNLVAFIKEANATFNTIAKTYPNVYFVDNSNLDPKDFNNIDFHPNHKGHAKIYRNFIKTYETAHK